MTQYAGTAKLATTIPLTDTNTPFNSSAVNAPDAANRDSIVALTNNGFYKTTLNAAKPPYPLAGDHENTGDYKLNGQILFTGTGKVAASSTRTYKRTASLIALADPAYWSTGPLLSTPKAHYVQLSVATAAADELLVFDFDVPSDCIITGISVKVQPVAHASLPQFKPKFLIYFSDVDAGTTALQAESGVDPSADVTAYNALHSIPTDSPLALTFNAGKNRIWIKFFGETGTDSATGLIVHLPVLTYTRTRIGEEFGEVVP